MNLIDRLQHTVKAATAAWSGPGQPWQWPMIRWSRPTKSKIYVNEDIAQTLSAVWACIGIRSDSLAQSPVGVFQKTRDAAGKVTVTEIVDHPVAVLLADGPTPDYATSVMLYTGQAQIDVYGNSYQEIVRNSRGEPVGLHFLDPIATNPEIADSGVFDIVEFYRTTRRGKERDVDPENVVHVKNHTLNGITGVSVLTAARETVGLGLAVEQFGSSYFANESKSGGFVIQPAETNARQKKEAQKNVASGEDDGQGGPGNAHKIKFLDPGVKFIATTIPPNDAQFLETRNFQVAEVSRFYRTPEVFLNSSAATSWGSGIEELKIGFVEMTIAPLATRWASEMTRKLLTPAERAAGYFIMLKTDRLLRGNAASQMAADASAIQYGVKTRNEVRGDRGLNPIEGGDIPLIPVNLADGRKPPELQSKQDTTNENPADDPNAK